VVERKLPVSAATPAPAPAPERPVVRSLRRVVLVQPPIGGNEADVTPPLGLLLLAALLEREGREVRLADLNLLAKSGGIDAAQGSIRTQLGKAIPRDADLLGFSCWSYNFDLAMEAVEEAKKKSPGVPIVLGGPHPTFVDREILATFAAVDYVLRDEGDWTFARLLRALETGAHEDDLAAIPGLTWRRGGEVVRNPSGPVVEELDALPYPAWHLVDVAAYLRQNPVLYLEAGRGCPYNCNFCSTTNMFQRKYRVKSPARLVDELEWTIARTGTNRFELLHDNLVASRDHVLAVCEEIRRRNLDVEWSCTSRPDNMSEELAEAMFLAGCVQVFFGVETLDPERQKWTGKKLKPPRIEAAVAAVGKHHMSPTAGIIVGFPDETDDELNATVSAAFRWTTEPEVRAVVSTAVLRYYPGADLFAHQDQLRWDPLAAADSCGIPGYRIRDKWRGLTALFPLQAIHTSAADTRRNLLRMHLLRTLLKAAPLTTRAVFQSGALTPRALLDALAAGREFRFLRFESRSADLMWNEVLLALGQVLRGLGRPELDELLLWEVPFWETRAVSPPLPELEHVIHPKRFEQASLLAWGIGRAEAPRPARGQAIVGLRGGREVFTCVSDRPTQVVEALRARLRALAPLAPRA
jgi:radical SAM superfamily enzyme YgiQ (UPF0313 family)